MKTIISNPENKDLKLLGIELLNIKIHYSSFSVFFQNANQFEKRETLEVNETIFPLRSLKKFFRLNGNSKYSLNRRSDSCRWAPNFDEKKRFAPELEAKFSESKVKVSEN